MTDHELRQHVENALEWDPSFDTRKIAVGVDRQIVTLRGDVASYAEKLAAEHAALRVYGVKGIANELEVRCQNGEVPTDSEIALAAVSTMAWNSMVPADRVGIAVSGGWVRLSGTLDWEFQRKAAECAVRTLRGVKGVSNDIALKPPATSGEVKGLIEQALKRSAELDARRITVAAANGAVVLNGRVRSWAERREAEDAAWSAPGVIHVDDQITVEP